MLILKNDMAKTRKRQETTVGTGPAAGTAIEDRPDFGVRNDAATASTVQEAPGNSSDSPISGRAGGAQPERVAARAYELYLARGAAHGSDWEDWLEAERQIREADAEPSAD